MSKHLTRLLSLILCLSLILEQSAFAQAIDLSGYFASNTPAQAALRGDKFRPLHLRYISYDTQSSDFKLLIDKGDFFNSPTPKFPNSQTPKLEEATQELMKYFFIGLALPNDKFWVNLRPDSPENILDHDLEKTDIGRIFLEADLQLKKDTSGFTSPQTPEGRQYWDKLYKRAGELFGTENITIPTITRPWIVPNEIIIREAPDSAYIYKATLKVMLEEDYLTSPSHQVTRSPNQLSKPNYQPLTSNYAFVDPRLKELNQYSTQLIKETIIPKLTYEINTSKRYAHLRQVYYSLILAQWFKQKYGPGERGTGNGAEENPYIKLIDSGNLTSNLQPLTTNQPYSKESYFKQYQKSFKEGEYNISEQVSAPQGQSIRRYVSGGIGPLKCSSQMQVIPATRDINHQNGSYLQEIYIKAASPEIPEPIITIPQNSSGGSAIGKMCDKEGNIVKSGIKAEISEDGKVVTFKDSTGNPLYEGKMGLEIKGLSLLPLDEDSETTLIERSAFLYSFLDNPEEHGLNEYESGLVKKILELLDKLRKEKKIHLLAFHDYLIYGFSDGENLFINKAYSDNYVALFHEAGEAYFALHPEESQKLGMSPHEFLRGPGKKARATGDTRQGLQDKLFGSANENLTKKLGLPPPNYFKGVSFGMIGSHFTLGQLKLAGGDSLGGIIGPTMGGKIKDYHQIAKEIYGIDFGGLGYNKWLAGAEELKKALIIPHFGEGYLGKDDYTINSESLDMDLINKLFLKKAGWPARLKILFRYHAMSWIASWLYPLAASHNWVGISDRMAIFFEGYCLRKKISLEEALAGIYGPQVVSQFKTGWGDGELMFSFLAGTSMRGFAKSHLTTLDKLNEYLDGLKAIAAKIGVSAIRQATEGIFSAGDFVPLVENPAFRPRVKVNQVSLVADKEFLRFDVIDSGRQDLISGMFLKVDNQDALRKDKQPLKDIIAIHEGLIEANFLALEVLNQFILSQDDKNETILKAVLEWTEKMLEGYRRLCELSGDTAYSMDEINRKWLGIKEVIANLDLKDKSERMKVFSMQDIHGDLNKVSTLHEFINFLHQASFGPLWQLAHKEKATLSLNVYGKFLDIVDISSLPLIYGNRVNSELLSIVLKAFDLRQSIHIRSTLIINDDTLIGHLNLGLHKAEIQAKLASPDEGGMILVRYQEWGTGRGNESRLVFLTRVMEGLGLEVERTGDRFIRIRLDKDKKAKGLEQIKKILPKVISVLYYSRDLDLSLKTELAAVQAASLFLAQGWTSGNFVGGFGPRALPDTPEVRKILNSWLDKFGLEPIPQGLKLVQAVIDRYVNEPVEERIERGEIVRNEGEELALNPDYHPIEDILEELSGDNGIEALQSAEIISSVSHLLYLRNIGAIGRCLVQVGTLKAASGKTIVVSALTDPEKNNVIFARLHERDRPWVSYAPEEVRELVAGMGIEPGPIEEISPQELIYSKIMLKEKWPGSPYKGTVSINGITSSLGQGRKAIGRVSLKKENARSADTILMVSHTEPADMEIIPSFSGIITTSGCVLSHAALTTRELKMPSIIIPGAELVQLGDGNASSHTVLSALEQGLSLPESGPEQASGSRKGNGWRIRHYSPLQEEVSSDGFIVSRGLNTETYYISEGSRIALDTAKGRIFIEIEPQGLDNIDLEEDKNSPLSSFAQQVNPLPLPGIGSPVIRRSESVIPLRGLRVRPADIAAAGYKAASQGDMMSYIAGKFIKGLGFKVRVPDGFGVTVRAFDDFIREAGIKAQMDSILQSEDTAQVKYDKIRQLFKSGLAKIGPKLGKAIQGYAWRISRRKGARWAVRSSNIDEDSEDAAFAGMGNTDLFVLSGDLLEKVIDNFASFATARSQAYRAKRGLSNSHPAHAVLVQEMVDADISGVVFSRNPVNANPQEVFINASYGLGEAVVGDLVQPDQYVIDKESGFEKGVPFIGRKNIKMIQNMDASGTKIVPVPIDMRKKRALSRYWVKKLTEATRGIESHYGFAVDIEFAIKGNTLYILQVRPITTSVKRDKGDSAQGQSASSGIIDKAGRPDNGIVFIKDVSRINWAPDVITKGAEIDKIVEFPLRKAVRILYDKNIQTFTTSANNGNIKQGYGYITIVINTLSPANKQILTAMDPDMYEDGRFTIAMIKIPLSEYSRCEEVGQTAVEIANKFKEQELEWGYYTPERFDEEFPPDLRKRWPEVCAAYVFDPQAKRYYFSQELLDKAKRYTENKASSAVGSGTDSLLKVDVEGADGQINSPSSANVPGGIAFGALPIRTESIASSSLSAPRNPFPVTRIPNLDLDAEWAQIQQIFNAGIRPSIQRLGEYTAVAAASPLADECIVQVRAMLADILRREEEDEKLTPADPALKGLLIALESNKP